MKAVSVKNRKQDQAATRRKTHDERDDRAHSPAPLVLNPIHAFIMAGTMDSKKGANERKPRDRCADQKERFEAKCTNI